MDNSGNGFNKLVVLLAVGILGVAAGQYLFKPGTPTPQQEAWLRGYAPQQQMTYAPPGFGPPNYAPQPSYGQPPQYLPTVPQSPRGYWPPTQTETWPVQAEAPRQLVKPEPSQPSFDGRPDLVGSQNFVSEIPTANHGSGMIVRTSAISIPTTLVPAVLGATISTTVQIKSIENNGIIWTGDTVPLTDPNFILNLEFSSGVEAGDTIEFVSPGGEKLSQFSEPAALLAGEKKRRFTITVTGGVDKVPFQVRLNRGGVDLSNPSSKRTIVLPDSTINLDAKVSNNIQTEPSVNLTDSSASPTAQIRSYGGYLKLEGTAPANATVFFTMLNTTAGANGDPLKPNFSQTNTNLNGDWSKELILPITNGVQTGKLVVRAESFTDHHISTTQNLDFTIAPPGKLTDRGLEVVEVKQGSNKNLSNGVYAREVPLTVTGRILETVAEGQVTLLVNGVPQPSSKAANSGDAIAFDPWTPSEDGQVELAIAVYQGKVRLATSEKRRTIFFRTSGPRPTGIKPDNLDLTPNANVLTIQFDRDHPIDPTSVEHASGAMTDTNNTRFELKSSRGVVLNPRSVTLDKTQNTVELRFDDIPPESYRLTIKQTVTDLFGNNLQADSTNTSGIDHTEFAISRSGTTIPPSPTPGLRGITGPFVPYMEYTKPRTNPAGFNPSDKVVTRVARLYYYRDAHRVVQLIKRDAARSYNRQAVDMQQQLADNARRDAENATDERKMSEQAAIEAAQRARAAETALTQFQQALVEARQQLDQVDIAFAAQQTKHETLKNTLESATAGREKMERLANKTPPEATEIEVGAAKDKEITAQRAVRSSEQAAAKLQSAQTAAQGQVDQMERHVNNLLGEVQNSRDDEAAQRELMNKKQLAEDRKHADLFRREVAAAHEDPDTYAPGDPESDDPIEQVSLSVIGEGLIQLRGPLKGVNLARTLINQIDAPVGQVKVAIHTVQVNGEHGKRMEPVVGRIQRYIDHSRFLTTQSSQMLRNAVTLVASRRADEAMAVCEGLGQHERDQKYIEAFFGREFLAELRTLDSEFLHTGNKLLSLHSMDSTSLANALFLLSLAKNDVRQEILQAFEQMVSCQLPDDEMEYFTASTEKYKFGPPFHKQKFQFLGHNAKFVSLKGFFNAEVAGAETLTPMQREFIRLAQIFKSRLVTEIELQQRVMERSLIEERLAAGGDEQQEAFDREQRAKRREAEAFETRSVQQGKLQDATSRIMSLIEAERQNAITLNREGIMLTKGFEQMLKQKVGGYDYAEQLDVMERTISELRKYSNQQTFVEEAEKYLQRGRQFYEFFSANQPAPSVPFVNQVTTDLWNVRKTAYAALDKVDMLDGSVKEPRKVPTMKFHFVVPDGKFEIEILDVQKARISGGDPEAAWNYADRLLRLCRRATEKFNQYELGAIARRLLSDANKSLSVAEESILLKDVNKLPTALANLKSAVAALSQVSQRVVADAVGFEKRLSEVQGILGKNSADVRAAFGHWILLRQEVSQILADGSSLQEQALQLFDEASIGFEELLAAETRLQIARQEVEFSRRPLDHKKFLDMLIDDVEDKFIELMEGTRAHTANIDNYLSRLGQALEDDFNTQFYFPAFKGIREASRYWDVNMGQIETTTILTNNRAFAKVSPQATMEFDLPKRDILIQEAFEAAEAAYSDYGALLGDPTFLSLVKMHRGQPASAQHGSGDSLPTTRNVLPGLPSSTDENLVAQNRAVAPDFPSALESLIPDPAIYKFETGTGFEIRPVIQPDGQAVVFHFNYMYTTNVREPVRADEKHLGRVKRHFIDTDVQIGNYEMREVSKYQVALKASRTSRGVPLLEDIPGAGVLFRPQPSQESSLQENIILAQTAIFPTLFDLMGLRWAPAVADLDALRLHEADFVTRGRQRALRERVFDYSSQRVDEFMQIPAAERRPDLYRSQETIPSVHPNGYSGSGLNQLDGVLREGYSPDSLRPESRYVPGTRSEGAVPRGMPSGDGLLIEEPPPMPSEPQVPSGLDHGPGYSRYGDPPPEPVRGLQGAVKNRNSRTVTADGAAPTESAPVLRLQSYQTETRPAATSAPRASAPRESRPLPKSTNPAPLPTPRRLPTTSGGQKPSAAREGDPPWYGWSSAVEPDYPVRPVSEVKSNGESRRLNIVHASAAELANPVKIQTPAPAKKKFGVTSLLPKKP